MEALGVGPGELLKEPRLPNAHDRDVRRLGDAQMKATISTENDLIKISIHDPCNTARLYVNGILVYEVERKQIKFVDIEFMESD